MDRIFPTKTHELCFALKDAGYQSEAVADPKAWNESLTNEQYLKGYTRAEDPNLGWYPNPGRQALAEEIEKLGVEKPNYKSFSHEDLMQQWLTAKQ